jgi:predicted membrane chloride channel (bestrophin family)
MMTLNLRALCLSLLLPLPLRSFQLKGSVLLTVWPQMAVCAGIAVFATIWRAYVGSEDFIIKDVKGHATLGTALAFLNVFRSNLSYGRYWDGRGQLGTLVKSGRELMRLVVTYSKVPEDPDEEAVRVPLLLLLLSRQRPRDARSLG